MAANSAGSAGWGLTSRATSGLHYRSSCPSRPKTERLESASNPLLHRPLVPSRLRIARCAGQALRGSPRSERCGCSSRHGRRHSHSCRRAVHLVGPIDDSGQPAGFMRPTGSPRPRPGSSNRSRHRSRFRERQIAEDDLAGDTHGAGGRTCWSAGSLVAT